MRIKIHFLIPALVLVILPFTGFTQETRTMSFDASSSMLLQEFNAMLTEEDGSVTVRLRIGNTPEDPNQADKLEQGDILLMMNGKRVESVAYLRESYEALAIGEEIKIGVKRGEQRFILSRKKLDADNMPGGGPQMMTLNFDSEDGTPPTLVPELGILLSEEGTSVKIASTVDMILPDELKALELQDYTLKEIAGRQPENAQQVLDILKEIETGEELSLVFEKDGEEKAITISKPESRGRTVIRTEN